MEGGWGWVGAWGVGVSWSISPSILLVLEQCLYAQKRSEDNHSYGSQPLNCGVPR